MPIASRFKNAWQRPFTRALIVFVALEIIVFRTVAHTVGFFHDDWVIRYWAAQGIGTMIERGFLIRPPQILHWPLVYAIAGESPLRGQLLIGTLKVLEAACLYRFLERLTGKTAFAMTAGALAILYPNRSIIHAWLSSTGQLAANAAMLASLTIHLSWIAERRKGLLAGSLALYIFAASLYESTALMPALLGAALWMREAQKQREWKRTFLSVLKDIAPYAGCFFVVFAWQRWLGPTVLGIENPRGIAVSLDHIQRVLFVGFECVFNRPLHLAVKSILPAYASLGTLTVFFVVSMTAATTLALFKSEERESIPVGLAAAAGCFFASYIPYALTGSYVPMLHRLMSRVNGVGALVGAILLACAFSALKPGKIKTATLAIVLSLFAVSDRFYYSQYAESWSLQKEIISEISDNIRGISGPVTVILAGAPVWKGEAVVFTSDYDLQFALIDRLKREDIKAVPPPPSRTFAFDKEGMVVGLLDGITKTRHSYKGLYLYHHSTRQFLKIDGPVKKELLLPVVD